MSSQHGFWILYDLGLKGDYRGMYKFLDTQKARECGDKLAFITREYQENFLKEIKEDIEKLVTINGGDRIYVIYKERTHGRTCGYWIYGSPKPAPWAGFSTVDVPPTPDDAQ